MVSLIIGISPVQTLNIATMLEIWDSQLFMFHEQSDSKKWEYNTFCSMEEFLIRFHHLALSAFSPLVPIMVTSAICISFHILLSFLAFLFPLLIILWIPILRYCLKKLLALRIQLKNLVSNNSVFRLNIFFFQIWHVKKCHCQTA